MDPISKGEASRLATAVVVEAMSELKRLYPGIRTHFISYRVASWSDTGFSSEDLAGFEYDLQQAGVMPLPLEAIIPRYRFALRDYVLAQPTITPTRERIDLSPNSSCEKSGGTRKRRSRRRPPSEACEIVALLPSVSAMAFMADPASSALTTTKRWPA